MTGSITSFAWARQAWPVLLAVGCATVTNPPPKPQPAKRTLAPEAHGRKFAVATENGDASRIAMEVLRAGGDSVDAAVAAALALGVATPMSCGIGGGGFAVVYRAKTRETYVIDFREVAPAGIDAEALAHRPLADNNRGHYIGVPGEVAGLHALATKYAKRPWRDDVMPAVNLAKNGFTLSSHLHRASRELDKELRTFMPTLASKLLDASGPLPIGTKVVRGDLSATLQKLAEQGPKAFYEGPIAQAMVDAAKSVGGTLSLDDLAKYQPKVRKAIRFKIGTREVITMPPPSAGGLMLAEVLRGHELMGKKGEWGTAETFHVTAELMRGAIDDRMQFIADPDAHPVDVNALFADERLKKRIAMIDPWSSKSGTELRIEDHGTSHLSIIDGEGNAIALTTTVNTGFGAKVIAGDTGIILNDQMDDFSNAAPNLPKAGAKPTSSMTPTIVLENDVPVMVAGGSGGTRIATSVALVSLAHLWFGLSAGDAVGWPRIHQRALKLTVEPTMSPTVLAELAKRGESLETVEAVNAVQLVTVARGVSETLFSAAADPRKGGVALAE
jgi:gamma-glutamyltranspeptidase / glutathione hydrolase